eukprot:CAMPEP_0167824666 /NCGR_PEP_ID=MMETSP0112_2-20121227/8923_1 /TAXON_ID=91324 /ORGANISM="Lotharella globosa, Strain CCCM811" /LENGTH=417 /DNA_ID=CAMNT_0007726659 /DNA_START=43 /DNA_END=1296 /DNA_ORIENTATION=-
MATDPLRRRPVLQIDTDSTTSAKSLENGTPSLGGESVNRLSEMAPELKFYGYRTSSDRGIAMSLKELMDRFEAAQMCGCDQGEWKSFNSRDEAITWALGKSSPSLSSLSLSVTSQSPKGDECRDFERKSKLDNESRLSSTFGSYNNLYSNDEKWSPSLSIGDSPPDWGSAQKTVFVDADGACPKNGRRGALGGIGVYFGPGDSRNISEPLPGHPQTNQRAELMSLIRAVEILRREGKKSAPVCLRSDSRYAVSGLTEWVPKWKRNGWTTARGTEVKNQDLWRRLDSEIAAVGTLRKVHLVWVKAHAGDRRNEEADRLATEGVRKAESIRHRLLASLPCLPPSSEAPQPYMTQQPARRIRINRAAPSYFSPEQQKKPTPVGLNSNNVVQKPLSSSFFSFDHKASFSFEHKSTVGRSVW